ncbi:NUDIX hydrolase [bacterium]|nr:MAG: NUDIX hydrolase [bacterium]
MNSTARLPHDERDGRVNAVYSSSASTWGSQVSKGRVKWFEAALKDFGFNRQNIMSTSSASGQSPETILSVENVFDGKVVRLRLYSIKLPSGHIGKREVLQHNGAVAILPVLPDGKIGLIRQWRTAANEWLLELPAGGIEPNEVPEECARRESIEEIGYKINKLSSLFECFLAPGYSSEVIYGYLAEDLEYVGAQPEPDENLEFVPVTLDEALALLDEGKIRDSKTICGLLAYARKIAK